MFSQSSPENNLLEEKQLFRLFSGSVGLQFLPAKETIIKAKELAKATGANEQHLYVDTLVRAIQKKYALEALEYKTESTSNQVVSIRSLQELSPRDQSIYQIMLKRFDVALKFGAAKKNKKMPLLHKLSPDLMRDNILPLLDSETLKGIGCVSRQMQENKLIADRFQKFSDNWKSLDQLWVEMRLTRERLASAIYQLQSLPTFMKLVEGEIHKKINTRWFSNNPPLYFAIVLALAAAFLGVQSFTMVISGQSEKERLKWLGFLTSTVLAIIGLVYAMNHAVKKINEISSNHDLNKPLSQFSPALYGEYVKLLKEFPVNSNRYLFGSDPMIRMLMPASFAVRESRLKNLINANRNYALKLLQCEEMNQGPIIRHQENNELARELAADLDGISRVEVFIELEREPAAQPTLLKSLVDISPQAFYPNANQGWISPNRVMGAFYNLFQSKIEVDMDQADIPLLARNADSDSSDKDSIDFTRP